MNLNTVTGFMMVLRSLHIFPYLDFLFEPPEMTKAGVHLV